MVLCGGSLGYVVEYINSVVVAVTVHVYILKVIWVFGILFYIC